MDKPTYDELEKRVRELEKYDATHKLVEELFQGNERFLEQVFDAIQDGISVLDTDLKVIKTNAWMKQMYASKKHLVGRKCFYIYQERTSPCPWCPALKTIEKGTVHTEIVPYPSVKNPKGWIELSAFPVKDDKGNVISVIEYVKDITERKIAEKTKIEAQKIAGDNEKLALVGQIAGKMAHDFNNVLGIIMGNTQLLISHNLDDKIKQKLDLIINQTLRGRNLTKNLVAFAKDQEPKQEFFKINEKIDLVVALMKKDLENISLNRSDAFDVPDLLADSGMIEHAIVNLLQNSIHALSLAPRPEITIKTFCRDDHIFLQIKDNGCGIPEIHLESIYAPSFSLKGSRDTTGSYSNLIKGTGYGMANVKKYIEQHRGSISVESEPGVGTQFTIQLPVINKELTVEEKKTIEERQIYPGQRILLVEDEVDISDVQYTILSDSPCNHQVDVAHNGRMALDLFDRNSYDLVSLDYILPGDINGMDIYHHIRRKKTEIPVLFTSGNLEFLQSIKDLKAKDKMIDHISKPCQNKEYLDQINKLLDRRNN